MKGDQETFQLKNSNERRKYLVSSGPLAVKLGVISFIPFREKGQEEP
jgi:hypothetical protein